MKILYTLLFILYMAGTGHGQIEKLKLHDNWKFSQQDKNEWRDASVPGSVHMDLYTNKKIEDRQAQLETLHREVFSQPRDNGHTDGDQPTPNGDQSLSDHQLLQKAFKARNGSKFKALWEGDTGGNGGDQSAADFALCSYLAFWTGKDANRMDALFRQSRLYRPKWDRRCSGDGRTYGQVTIEKALAT